MEIANLSIAIIALIVAILAIIISWNQAKKSDNIAQLGLRIEFYNYICEFINKYKIVSNSDMMRSAKNSEKIFRLGANTPLVEIVIGVLGNNNPNLAFQQMIKDYNYLDVNKFLFNKELVSKIDQILVILKELRTISSECFQRAGKDSELKICLSKLKNLIDLRSDELLEEVKQEIAVDKKYKSKKNK